jgi:putative nucleotidyltransferase with HDIG domain
MQLFAKFFGRFAHDVALRLALYQAVVAIVALTALIVSVGVDGPPPFWPTIGLAAIAAAAERARVKLSSTIESSISLLPTVFAAAVLGPAAAIFVGAASFIGEINRPYPHRRLRWGIYTCIRAITGAAAAGAASAAAFAGTGTARIVVATAIAGVVAETLDLGFAALTMALRGGDMRTSLRTMAPVAAASLLLYAPVVALLGIAYAELTPWTLVFFFVPALAAQRLFGLYQEQRRLADDLGELNERLEAANLSFATALVATLDARDRYTAGHSAAVAIYARDIARRMGLSEEQQNLAHLSGLVHDIGKIGLPAGLLEKPGALTLDERREMQRHSEIGERILANVETYSEIAAVVRHHHERVDGEGYPDGLESDQIPLLARIIAVADAYNAMTSDRPYRDAMPSRVARLRLAQAVETQFDTSVVAAFEAILAAADEEYRLATRADFRLGVQDHEQEETFVLQPVRSELVALAVGE